MVKLPDEIKILMDNGSPAVLVTCSKEGIPNTTIISQVYYVDDSHVALSFQFFNKTAKNVRENPQASILLTDISGRYIIQAEYKKSEDSGDTFEKMDMQIEAIASASGMKGVFKLKSAEIYKVKSFRKIPLGE